MNTNVSGDVPVKATSTRSAGRNVLEQERRFYVIAAVILFLVTVFGFRQFLMFGKGADGIPITPQILPLVVTHGMALLMWVTLLVVQSLLIVTGRRRIHMTLGVLGVVLAGAIVLLSAATAILSARHNPAIYEEFGGARYFLAFALTATVLFGTMSVAGIIYRTKPDVHRPLMLLATVAMMTGPFDRWPFIPWLMEVANGHVPVFHWGPTLLLGAALLALHTVMVRRLSRWHAVGYASVVAVTAVSCLVAGSAAWNALATQLVP